MSQKQQTKNHSELSGKRIVVLGGSSGIGLAVAQQAATQGATAIIASSNADRVKQAVATLDAKAEGHAFDLSNENDIKNFFQKVGDFDHLVFTAGDTLQLNELVETDLTKARRAFELRYWAVLAAVKHASTHIRQGRINQFDHWCRRRRPHKGWTLAASVCGAIVRLRARSPLNSLRYASMRFHLESYEPTFGRTCRRENETTCTKALGTVC